jgi:putative N6-adenine-specific DNA methylase
MLRGVAAPGPSSRPDAAAPAAPREWFAVVAPGGEAAVARELAALAGVAQVRPEPGGVAFLGDLGSGLRANLWLRGATRVLLRIGSFRARDFDRLRRGAARLDWKAVLPAETRVAVQVAQRGSRLYHTGAVAERVGLALRDACGPGLEIVPAADAAQSVHVRGERDRWTLSLDASGPRLDRRGWRLERGAAAVRETLAALVLALCEWDPELAFADGLCGAGTFAIEAAQVALRIAPGAGRSFACERWPCLGAARTARLRREAETQRRAAPPAAIVAADRSARALAVAQRNARRAGVADAIRFEATEFAGLAPPAPRGLLVLDPPYGRRLGDRSEARAGYARLARDLSRGWSGWRVGLLAPAPSLAAGFPGRRAAHHVLPHGGLRVHLYVLDLC